MFQWPDLDHRDKQRSRSMAFVVVGPGGGATRLQWQTRLRPIEHLHLALLVANQILIVSRGALIIVVAASEPARDLREVSGQSRFTATTGYEATPPHRHK